MMTDDVSCTTGPKCAYLLTGFSARCFASTVLAVVVCPSVHPSVTCRYCIKMVKCWIMKATPHDNPKISTKFEQGHPPTGTPNLGGVG